MYDEATFEIIGKGKTEDDGSEKSKDKKILPVPVPAALPTFIETPSTSDVFHPTVFSPEIPKDKEVTSDDLEGPDSSNQPEGGFFGWMKDTVGTKGSNILSMVAETAKQSVDSVISTLDPQMRDFGLDEGKKITIASDKEVEISAIREAFQLAFNKINIRALDPESVEVPKQTVGFLKASVTAQAKIDYLRTHYSVKGPIVAVQDFIVDLTEDGVDANSWNDLDLLLIDDPDKSVNMKSYSQMIPVPAVIMNLLKQKTTDGNYKDTGFDIPVSHLMGDNLQVHPSEWQEAFLGVSRRERIFWAAKVLANSYKNTF